MEKAQWIRVLDARMILECNFNEKRILRKKRK